MNVPQHRSNRAWQLLEASDGDGVGPSHAPAVESLGALRAKVYGASGIELHARLGAAVAAGQPLLTIHADAPGELDYARAYLAANPRMIDLSDTPAPAVPLEAEAAT